MDLSTRPFSVIPCINFTVCLQIKKIVHTMGRLKKNAIEMTPRCKSPPAPVSENIPLRLQYLN